MSVEIIREKSDPSVKRMFVTREVNGSKQTAIIKMVDGKFTIEASDESMGQHLAQMVAQSLTRAAQDVGLPQAVQK